MAVHFAEAGFKRLHVVDLDGARAGKPKHAGLLSEICRRSGMEVDFGGGIRSGQNVKDILEAGAKMASIGSIAVKSPETVKEWIGEFGASSFFLGADVIGEKIATHAWTQTSSVNLMDFLGRWKEDGIRSVFCTDVSKDGKLEGPALDLYIRIKRTYPDIYLVASGGVSNVEDIQKLDDAGIDGVIFGKAFYDGKIRIDELKKWL